MLVSSTRKLSGSYPTNHNTNSRKVPLLSLTKTRGTTDNSPQSVTLPIALQSWTRKPLARGFHFVLLLLPNQRLYIVKNMYTHTHTHTHTHTSDCIENLHELPFLPNNTATETLLLKSVAVRSVDWIFTVAVPACRLLGEYVTWTKRVTIFCVNL